MNKPAPTTPECRNTPPGDPWERALSGSSDGLWEWRIGGDAWCAPQFWRQLGFAPSGDGTPCDFTTLLHPADVSPITAKLRECCQAGTTFDEQFRIQTVTGEFRWFRAQAAAYQDAAGNPYSVAGAIKDITGFKMSADATREREKRSYRQQRMDALDCLASGIAHEFNNLLQAVHGYISFAVGGLNPELKAVDDLRNALSAVDIATTLTRRLLDFAGAEVQPEHLIDVNDTVRGLIDLARPILGGGISFTSELCDQPLIVLGDDTSLRQALLNLCINARDAMPEGGDLVVRTERFELAAEFGASIGELKPGAYARITVSDTGTGIPGRLHDKVFQPFFTTKEIGKGTGLGLPAVLGTVEAYGGHIELHTAANAGTTFAVYLPLAQATIAQPVEPIRDLHARVLYVEHNAAARESGRRMLEVAGCTVTCADNSVTALEVLRRLGESFDAVVLDASLPGQSGPELLRDARAFLPNLACILCAGSRLAALHDFAGLKVSRVLQKPFDASDVAGAVQACVRPAEPAAAPKPCEPVF